MICTFTDGTDRSSTKLVFFTNHALNVMKYYVRVHLHYQKSMRQKFHNLLGEIDKSYEKNLSVINEDRLLFSRDCMTKLSEFCCVFFYLDNRSNENSYKGTGPLFCDNTLVLLIIYDWRHEKTALFFRRHNSQKATSKFVILKRQNRGT